MSIKTAIDKIIEYASIESEIPLGQAGGDREVLEKILLQEMPNAPDLPDGNNRKYRPSSGSGAINFFDNVSDLKSWIKDVEIVWTIQEMTDDE